MQPDSPLPTIRGILNKYTHDLEEKESQVEGLQAEIAKLRNKIEVANDMLAEASKNGKGVHTVALNGIGKYSKMGATDAILDVVNTYGNTGGLFVPEIITILKAEGFAWKKVKNPYASVYAIAMSLVDQERITEGSKNGKRTFVGKRMLEPNRLQVKMDG